MNPNPLFSDWEAIFDTLPSGVIVLEGTDRVIKINSQAKTILGFPAEEDCFERLAEFPPYLDTIRKVFLESPTDLIRSELDIQLPGEEESRIIGFTLKTILHQETPPYRVFIFSDITQVQKERLTLDKIKEELYQSKKLASIGTMISGVAHELNNPLTGISMSSELTRLSLERLKKKIDPSEQAQILSALDTALKEVNKITVASTKAAALVNDLLTYSKPTQLDLSSLSLQGLLEDIIQALKSHPAFSQVKFRLTAPSHDIQVLCDKVKLEQVFYNLFKNASDATEGKGSIKVCFTETEEQVTVIVRDNGPGIDKTVMSRIFDPFFTTKGNSGVGLGLSISYRTIEQHGGLLSVDSVKGEGTAFHVLLPRYRDSEME